MSVHINWKNVAGSHWRQNLLLANGIAAHDTFGRAFSSLNAKQLDAFFMHWISGLCSSLAERRGQFKATNEIIVMPELLRAKDSAQFGRSRKAGSSILGSYLDRKELRSD